MQCACCKTQCISSCASTDHMRVLAFSKRCVKLVALHAAQVHKIAILDIRLLNGDRNDANVLVRRLPSSGSNSSGSSSHSSHHNGHHHSNSHSSSSHGSHHSSNGDSSNGHSNGSSNGSSKQVRTFQTVTVTCLLLHSTCCSTSSDCWYYSRTPSST
jgi:hypothetical protein